MLCINFFAMSIVCLLSAASGASAADREIKQAKAAYMLQLNGTKYKVQIDAAKAVIAIKNSLGKVSELNLGATPEWRTLKHKTIITAVLSPGEESILTVANRTGNLIYLSTETLKILSAMDRMSAVKGESYYRLKRLWLAERGPKERSEIVLLGEVESKDHKRYLAESRYFTKLLAEHEKDL